jgi:hypothetical protein
MLDDHDIVWERLFLAQLYAHFGAENFNGSPFYVKKEGEWQTFDPLTFLKLFHY